jgi:hypothetical protein
MTLRFREVKVLICDVSLDSYFLGRISDSCTERGVALDHRIVVYLSEMLSRQATSQILSTPLATVYADAIKKFGYNQGLAMRDLGESALFRISFLTERDRRVGLGAKYFASMAVSAFNRAHSCLISFDEQEASVLREVAAHISDIVLILSDVRAALPGFASRSVDDAVLNQMFLSEIAPRSMPDFFGDSVVLPSEFGVKN